MKIIKNIIDFPVCLLIFLALVFSAQAQTKQALRFPKGSNSTTVTGKIVSGKPVIYFVNARKGQSLEFDIADSEMNNDVVAEVFAPDDKSLTGEDYGKQWRGKLPRNGVYKISVGTIESENADFKVRITIR
jgi:hypothetical protein